MIGSNEAMGPAHPIRVCFIGGMRYSQPLEPSQEKKFALLRKLGEIFVIGFSDSRSARFRQHAEFYLFKCFRSPFLRYLTMFAAGPLLVLWVIHRCRVNILVAQSPYEGFAAAWGKLLGRLSGRKVALIVESHGDFENALFLQRAGFAPAIHRFLMRLTAGFAMLNADGLRSVSEATKEQLGRWSSGRPVQRFPTWTDIEVFINSGREYSGPRSPSILYAGVLTPLKGVHFLIDAFQRLAGRFDSLQLWVVGEHLDDEYSKLLKASVKRQGISDRVTFFGQVSQQRLAEMMARAQMLVLPSQSEGLPRVIGEAMALGLPVIASNVGGITELIQHEVNGLLVEPGDVAGLARCITRMLTDPAQAEVFIRRASDNIGALWSPQSYLEGYRKLFTEVRS